MNLKYKSRNLKREKKKNNPNGQLSKPTYISKIKVPGVGGRVSGLVLYLVVWLAVCLLKTAIFEVDA